LVGGAEFAEATCHHLSADQSTIDLLASADFADWQVRAWSEYSKPGSAHVSKTKSFGVVRPFDGGDVPLGSIGFYRPSTRYADVNRRATAENAFLLVIGIRRGRDAQRDEGVEGNTKNQKDEPHANPADFELITG
jgi:hypothetical protein